MQRLCFPALIESYVQIKSVIRTFTKTLTMSGKLTQTIENKLKEQLNTTYLDVINESYMHNAPKGSETHFKVVVVSEKFDKLPLLKRHRLVNGILKEELEKENGIHALSIVAKTPEQWENSDQEIKPSPNCRGGFGK